ncbi:MAG: hypothetical protein HY691_02080 [Chloroflexi bacterium]|nr:hypothetical protein [Chloroflexota bacterium]
MATLRAPLHGLILSLANVVSIIVAFGIYTLVRPANQIALQAPVAAALSVLGFALWVLLAGRLAGGGKGLAARNDFVWAFVSALLWAPAVFVPLHYVTQGYMTSIGNIVALWAFQVPTNLAAMLVARSVALRRSPA